MRLCGEVRGSGVDPVDPIRVEQLVLIEPRRGDTDRPPVVEHLLDVSDCRSFLRIETDCSTKEAGAEHEATRNLRRVPFRLEADVRGLQDEYTIHPSSNPAGEEGTDRLPESTRDDARTRLLDSSLVVAVLRQIVRLVGMEDENVKAVHRSSGAEKLVQLWIDTPILRNVRPLHLALGLLNESERDLVGIRQVCLLRVARATIPNLGTGQILHGGDCVRVVLLGRPVPEEELGFVAKIEDGLRVRLTGEDHRVSTFRRRIGDVLVGELLFVPLKNRGFRQVSGRRERGAALNVDLVPGLANEIPLLHSEETHVPLFREIVFDLTRPDFRESTVDRGRCCQVRVVHVPGELGHLSTEVFEREGFFRDFHVSVSSLRRPQPLPALCPPARTACCWPCRIRRASSARTCAG